MACEIVPFVGRAGVCNRCGATLTGRRTAWCSSDCETEWQRNHYWQMARPAAVARDGGRCVRCGSTGDRRVWSTLHSWDRRHRRQILNLGIDPDSISGVHRLQVAKTLPWLEVNHIEPRVGRGYNSGCHHHLTNLETLCHACHVGETKRQGAERRLMRKLAAPGTLFDSEASA